MGFAKCCVATMMMICDMEVVANQRMLVERRDGEEQDDEDEDGVIGVGNERG